MTQDQKPSLRELIAGANKKLETFKYPDVTEAKTRINELLVAAGTGDIKDEELSDLYVHGNEVQITTKWWARDCKESSSYWFPASILDAADPVKAAKVWGLESRIEGVKHSIDNLHQGLKEKEAKLMELQATLDTFNFL